MLTNIYILLDSIKLKGVTLVEGAHEQTNSISSIRRIRTTNQPMEARYLYACSQEEYLAAENKMTAKFFAIIGSISEEVIYKNGHHALIFPVGTSITDVIDILQDILDFYSDWYGNIMKEIYRGKSLQNVFDLAVTVLQFPIGLFDKSSILIASAGKIPDDTSSSVWADVLSDKHFPNNEVSPAQTRSIYESMMKNQWPVVYRSKKHDEFHITSALFLKGHFFGILGAASFTQFSQGQISLFWKVKKIMEWSLLQNMQLSGHSEGIPYFVERMLSGYHIEEYNIMFQLHNLNWKANDEFLVICMKPFDGGPLYENDCLRYMGSIRELFTFSITFYYEGSITSIVKIFGKSFQNHNQLYSTLAKYGLKAGISMRFQNFLHLEYAYIQCKHALLYGTNTITEFHDIYNTYLIKTLEQATSLKSMCHPRILQYWQQGGKQEYEYIHCLQVYLRNGRCLTDTAKKLNLHRNTLIYRLKKMGELLELDLRSDLIDDDYISLLSTSCEITQYLQSKSSSIIP